jgi:membrane-bound lytic murein transglycosylase D
MKISKKRFYATTIIVSALGASSTALYMYATSTHEKALAAAELASTSTDSSSGNSAWIAKVIGGEEKSAAANVQGMALLDEKHRLGDDFKIPEGLEQRVAFWLDVYSKYDSRHFIIHHRDYPWVIFDIVDTTDIFKQQRVQWLNKRDAETLAKIKRDSVLTTLKMLAVRSSFDNLPPEEARIFNLLKDIPGTRKEAIRDTLHAIRIQLGQKDMFEMGLIRSAPFIPMMEKIFEAQGLPTELVRIPLVESSFNIEAHSKVGAAGAWQIMPNVGRKKLIINSMIDERDSPLKATTFAASLLKENKKILKNWPLSVTAYNHGSGSLLKAVHKLKTDDLQEIIDQNSERSFQFASSNFYACFMAALRGEKYAPELFPEVKRPTGMELTKIKIAKSVTAGSFAKKNGLELKQLQAMNPDLPERMHANFMIPAGFQIYVPAEQPAVASAAANVNASAAATVTDVKSLVQIQEPFVASTQR